MSDLRLLVETHTSPFASHVAALLKAKISIRSRFVHRLPVALAWISQVPSIGTAMSKALSR